jgi:dienelactone hydrolase
MIGLLAVAGAACLGQAGPNLAANEGFEEADGASPAFWEQRTPTDGQRELAWVDEAPHAGAKCLRIVNVGDVKSRWRTGHLHNLRLRPGAEATLSGWVRHKGPGAAYLTLYFLGTKGEVIAQPITQRVTGEAPWTRVSVTGTAPDDAAYTMLYCENEGQGTAWFDDLELHGEPWDGEPRPEPERIALGVDELDAAQGLERKTVGTGRAADLRPGEAARIEVWFGGPTARYDVQLGRTEEPTGAAELRLTVNGQAVDWTDTGTEQMVARGVDIQHHSRVAIEGALEQGQQCRVKGVTFVCTGGFAGTLLPPEGIALPPSLHCCPTALDRRAQRAQVNAYAYGQWVKLASDRREAELAALKTPEDWRQHQLATREKLPEILGDFGEKCALNPRIPGRIERETYTIEKVIIESQPGYLVPCNFYVPKGRSLPAPGVLFTCGHSAEGKGYHLYHECCLGFVLKGYCVLAVDPMGQGERSEYFDPESGRPTVPLTVAQHHQLLRPSWLVGRSLAGYRTWDLHRAVDYLVSRPEVDAEKLAVVGNSGGGQMALPIMAYDERLDVCAAAHPGGSCENVYLTGEGLVDRELLGLIAPRACRFIVGRDSGEEAGHRAKYDDMLRYYRGLGADEQRLSFVLVDGVHNMEQPKREAAYEWVNRWLGKESEGSAEPALAPETPEALWCTESGSTIRSLGSESGRTLDMKVAEAIRPQRSAPADEQSATRMADDLREAVRRRIGARDPAGLPAPTARSVGQVDWDGIAVQKLMIGSEPGIELPALLLRPAQARPGPAILHVAEEGKPTGMAEASIPLELAKRGHVVLSIDVRGVGENDPSPQPPPSRFEGYNPAQWGRDLNAIRAAYAGTTMLAMRAFDVSRAAAWLRAQPEFAGREVVVVGEGFGGVWAMAAAAFDGSIGGVVCRQTVLSYANIIGTQYYRARACFYVPGALADYDLPDLPALVAPRPVMWLDTVDAELRQLSAEEVTRELAWARSVYAAVGKAERLSVARTEAATASETAEAILRFLQAAR